MDTTPSVITIQGHDYPLEWPGFVRARQIAMLSITDAVLGDYAALLLACPRLRAKVKIPDYSAAVPLGIWADEYAPRLTDTKRTDIEAELQREVVRATLVARRFVWGRLPSQAEVDERVDFFEEAPPETSNS